MEKTINKLDVIITGTDEFLKREKQELDKKICRYKKQKKWSKIILVSLISIVFLVLALVVYKVISGEFDIVDVLIPIRSFSIIGGGLITLIWFGLCMADVILFKFEIKEEEINYKELEKEIGKLVDGTATIDKITLSEDNVATVLLCYIVEGKYIKEIYEFSLKFEKTSRPAEYPLFKIDFDKDKLIYFLEDDYLEPDKIFGDYKVAKEVK